MSPRAGRQDDDWIPEAKRLAGDGIETKIIAKQFGVSMFRVQCAVIPGFRERRREQVNAQRKPRGVRRTGFQFKSLGTAAQAVVDKLRNQK